MEYAIAKLKTAEIVGMGAKHLAQIDTTLLIAHLIHIMTLLYRRNSLKNKYQLYLG